MTAEYFSIVTTLGLARIATAFAEGTAVTLREFAVGDGGGVAHTPVAGQVAPRREVFRARIADLSVDPNSPNVMIAECAIPDAEGGWTAREIALFDDRGDMIAIGGLPATAKPALASGAGAELIFRVMFTVTDATDATDVTDVTIEIDPAIVLASRRYVDAAIAAHDADPAAHAARRAPDATTDRRGVAELATGAETASGTDPERVVTPFGPRAAIPPVLRPRTVTPADGATAVGEAPTLTGSAYHGLYGLPQGGVDFEVLDAGGETVHAATTAGAGVAYTLPAGILRISTAYRWRCRHAAMPTTPAPVRPGRSRPDSRRRRRSSP